MTIDRQIESLIQVAGRLIGLMEREIAMLRAMRPQDLETLRAEKAELVAAYEQRYQDLARHRDALARVTPALMEEFAAVSTRFNATLAENGRALSAARVAHERMMAAIVEAVKTNRGAGHGYSPRGETQAGQDGGPVSLSLDCRL